MIVGRQVIEIVAVYMCFDSLKRTRVGVEAHANMQEAD